jgi:hypothetical protein
MKLAAPQPKQYEIRLCREDGGSLLFATLCDTDDHAVIFARDLLERHKGYTRAEVWAGSRRLRSI